MPIYVWRCKNEDCASTVEVLRPISEYETGPEEPCKDCCGENFKRIIPEWKKEQTHLVHGGVAPWEAESYFNGRIPTGR